MATELKRFTVSIDDETFQHVEDFRFENRFQNRADATIALIRLGLEASKAEQGKQSCMETETM